MANLWTGEVVAKDYKSISAISGVTFTNGEKYMLQVDGIAYLREGTLGKGFIVKNSDVLIEYTASSDVLYIKTDGCVLNIAGAS